MHDTLTTELGLRNTIAELLDVPVEHLNDQTFAATELDTDSLIDVALILEDAHQMRFTESELSRFTCLKDILDCLQEKR
jgi:acyl carrier protein